MRVLHLTLKKKWFDMVGVDKWEEYRELKDYWGARLCYRVQVPWGGHLTKWTKLREGDRKCLTDDFMPNFEKFDIVEFKNGYSKSAPAKRLKFIETKIGTGKPEWGAEPNKEYFIIKLGELFNPPN